MWSTPYGLWHMLDQDPIEHINNLIPCFPVISSFPTAGLWVPVRRILAGQRLHSFAHYTGFLLTPYSAPRLGRQWSLCPVWTLPNRPWRTKLQVSLPLENYTVLLFQQIPASMPFFPALSRPLNACQNCAQDTHYATAYGLRTGLSVRLS